MSGDVPDQDAMGSLVRQLAIFQQETSSIINIFLYLTLAIFIIYIIFQGLSWKYCFKAAKIKIKSNLGFFIRFSLLNVVWFALVALSVYVIADKYFKSALAQDAGFNPLLYIIPIGVILIYFSMISYTIIRNNSLINTIFKTFSMGVKKAIYILPAFLIIAVLFLIIDLILIGLYKVSSIAMISAGFILIIPSIIWSKLFLIELINKIEKKK